MALGMETSAATAAPTTTTSGTWQIYIIFSLIIAAGSESGHSPWYLASGDGASEQYRASVAEAHRGKRNPYVYIYLPYTYVGKITITYYKNEVLHNIGYDITFFAHTTQCVENTQNSLLR